MISWFLILFFISFSILLIILSFSLLLDCCDGVGGMACVACVDIYFVVFLRFWPRSSACICISR